MQGGRWLVSLMTRLGKKRWHSWIPRPLRKHLRALELERDLAALSDEYTSKFEEALREDLDVIGQEWERKSGYLNAELGKIRTDKLVRRAERRGIDLHAKQEWWDSIDEGEWTGMESHIKVLTDTGLAQAKRLIRDDFRQSVKWWVEVVALVIAALTGLGGTVIGVLSLL